MGGMRKLNEGTKLARDKIPEIMKAKGQKALFRKLDESEYHISLRRKLEEEVEEFLEDESLEEMADILEVLHAFLKLKGKSFEEVEAVRKNKAEQRGGFQKRILIEIE